MNIFDHLNNITLIKSELDEPKTYDPYIVNRFVSMSDLYILLVNEINKFQLDKRSHHDFFVSALPKRKEFFKYIKKKKEKINQKIIDVLEQIFELGTKDAEILYNSLSDNDIKELEKNYINKGK